jgi:hypothetical protein
MRTRSSTLRSISPAPIILAESGTNCNPAKCLKKGPPTWRTRARICAAFVAGPHRRHTRRPDDVTDWPRARLAFGGRQLTLYAMQRLGCVVESEVKRTGKPRHCSGAFLRCSFGLVVYSGVQPDRAIPTDQAIPTDRAASGAQKSVRSAQCGSQAIAQKHQGPRGCRCTAGPGTAAATVAKPQQQYLPVMVEDLRLSRPAVRGVNRPADIRSTPESRRKWVAEF